MKFRWGMFFSFSCLIVTVYGCALVSARHWDGYTDWTFEFIVVDNDSNRPIENAEISIVVRNETSMGDIESFVKDDLPKKCITDSDGRCSIKANFNAYGNESLWKPEAFVNYRHRNLMINADGYATLDLPLKGFVETPKVLHSIEELKKITQVRIGL